MKEFKCYKDNCNECKLLKGKYGLMIYQMLNEIVKKFDENGEIIDIVNKYCANLTVCPDCRIDDFVHIEDCKIDNEEI